MKSGARGWRLESPFRSPLRRWNSFTPNGLPSGSGTGPDRALKANTKIPSRAARKPHPSAPSCELQTPGRGTRPTGGSPVKRCLAGKARSRGASPGNAAQTFVDHGSARARARAGLPWPQHRRSSALPLMTDRRPIQIGPGIAKVGHYHPGLATWLRWPTLLCLLAGWLPILSAPVEVVSGKDRTFRAGVTYLVAGPVRLEGSVRFEAGCVLKFQPGRSAGLELGKDARVSWQATPEAPIVFTASDDDSVGELVPGSTGKPSSGPYADVALSVNGARLESGQSRWNDFRISHARVALRWTGTTAALWHFQVQHCQVGIESTIVDLTGPEPRVLRPGSRHPSATSDRAGSMASNSPSLVPRSSTANRRIPPSNCCAA